MKGQRTSTWQDADRLAESETMPLGVEIASVKKSTRESPKEKAPVSYQSRRKRKKRIKCKEKSVQSRLNLRGEQLYR